MLLRLRQICSHPALIQETSGAFIAADQLIDGHDLKAELARAARLVSTDFVNKLKEKYFQDALTLIQAEKEVRLLYQIDLTTFTHNIYDNHSPLIPLLTPKNAPSVWTHSRKHALHRAVIHFVGSVSPMSSTLSPSRTWRILVNTKAVRGLVSNTCNFSSPCSLGFSGPSCRAPISSGAIFIRAAFEPTDAELSGEIPSSSSGSYLDSDDEMPGISDMIIRGTKGKGKARLIRKKRAVYDSDSDDDDDDMSDFIVEDDEDEEENNTRRELKKRLRKRRAMVVESDDDLEEDEREVVIGRSPRKVPASMGEVKTMSRFLPSTKMNVSFKFFMSLSKRTYNFIPLANDGHSREMHSGNPWRQGAVPHLV